MRFLMATSVFQRFRARAYYSGAWLLFGFLFFGSAPALGVPPCPGGGTLGGICCHSGRPSLSCGTGKELTPGGGQCQIFFGTKPAGWGQTWVCMTKKEKKAIAKAQQESRDRARLGMARAAEKDPRTTTERNAVRGQLRQTEELRIARANRERTDQKRDARLVREHRALDRQATVDERNRLRGQLRQEDESRFARERETKREETRRATEEARRSSDSALAQSRTRAAGLIPESQREAERARTNSDLRTLGKEGAPGTDRGATASPETRRSMTALGVDTQTQRLPNTAAEVPAANAAERKAERDRILNDLRTNGASTTDRTATASPETRSRMAALGVDTPTQRLPQTPEQAAAGFRNGTLQPAPATSSTINTAGSTTVNTGSAVGRVGAIPVAPPPPPPPANLLPPPPVNNAGNPPPSHGTLPPPPLGGPAAGGNTNVPGMPPAAQTVSTGGAVGTPGNTNVPGMPPAPGTVGTGAQTTTPAGGNANVPPQTANKIAANYQNNHDRNAYGKSDQCSVSAQIDGKYACQSTVSFAQTSNMMGMMSMMMGSSVAQSAGSRAQANVLNGGANAQQLALESSAQASEATGKTQGAIGLANTAMALMLIKKGYDHEGHARSIDSGARQVTQGQGTDDSTNNYNSSNAKGRLDDSSGSVASKIVLNFELNKNAKVTAVDKGHQDEAAQRTARDTENEQHLAWGKNQARAIASDADGEQKAVASQAKMQGMMGAMIGMQQLMSAKAALDNAKNMRAQAAALANQNQGGGAFVAGNPISGDLSAGTQVGTSPDMITGSGDNPNAAPADSTEGPSGDPGNFGQGFNPNPLPSSVAGGPTAGGFNPGKPEGGGGGGGPAAVGGAGTSAASDTPTETQAKPAGNTSGDRYESGGTFSGGGGGGGKGAEGGPDLTSMLGQLLPKKEEANQASKSILDYSGGSAQPSPLHPANDKLFDSISSEYYRQVQKGAVGG